MLDFTKYYGKECIAHFQEEGLLYVVRGKPADSGNLDTLLFKEASVTCFSKRAKVISTDSTQGKEGRIEIELRGLTLICQPE